MTGFATIVVGRDGCITGWDAGATALLGHSPQTMLGKSAEAIIPPEYRMQHRAGFSQAMAVSKDSAAAGFHLPVLVASGSTQLFGGRLTLHKAADGTTVGAALVLQPAQVNAETFSPFSLP